MAKSIETAERTLVSTVTEQHDYIYASGKLLRETVMTTEGSTSTTQSLDFFYDASGTPYALKADGITYYYVTNLQGDVVRLVNSGGSTVASYEYDPYGNIISQSGDMAEVNPLRYRSYYFDSESGFYYLQSRYYDPEIGRFINADSYASTGQSILGLNMFAYCNNNPINMTDSSGCFPVCSYMDPSTQIGWEVGNLIAGEIRKRREQERAAIADGTVAYSSKGTEKGGEIKNSHLIRSIDIMYNFIDDN